MKKSERVLIFTDKPSPKETIEEDDLERRQRLRDIALLIAETGRSFAKELIFCEYPATTSHGKEPPLRLWEYAFGKRAVNALKEKGLLSLILKKKVSNLQLREAQAIIRKYKRYAPSSVIALSNYSTTHTTFRELLTKVCGSKYASMPIFDPSMLEGPMNVNYRELKKQTEIIAKTLRGADMIRLKTPNGTHLIFSKRGRKVDTDTGILRRKGSYGNLPAGEVYLAPLEGTADGRLILEWAPMRRLESPITLTIKNGFVIELSGSEPYVSYLREKLRERRENGNIAELGIGTNDRARRPDNILESEKILGTVHIGLGDNSSFGGKVKTPFHQDFVFFKPTVILIDKKGKDIELMREGRFDNSILRDFTG